jgi:hypothetical protein
VIAAGAADETMVAESDRSLIAVGNIPHFLRGMAIGFGDGAIGFVDGAVTAVRGVGQYAYFVWVHWTDGADAAAGTSAGQAIDSAAVLTLKYGPEVARIIQEIHAGQLSPKTWGLIAQVQPLVDEILDAIAEEFDSLSVEEQAELIGRITTATIVEVVAFVGTAGAGTALSVAAKTGKLANITSKLGGYSSKLTNKVSAAIGKFVNKVDKVAPKGVVDFAESTGRLGGDLWGVSRIPTLTRYLSKRGVKVVTDADDLLAKLAKQRGLPGADAAFIVGKDGKLWFLLSKNPTRREVLHELGHFLHRQKIGPEAYGNLTTAQKETWLSNFLRDSNAWKNFTPEEQWREIQNILKYTEGQD